MKYIKNPRFAVLACIILFAFFINHIAQNSQPASFAAATRPAEEPQITEAAKYAVDYELFRRESLESEAAARRFLMLAHCSIFDGGGAEVYGGDCNALLHHYGDERFSKIIKSMDNSVEKDGLKMIAVDEGIFDGADEMPEAENRFVSQFPNVAEIMKRLGVI